VNLALSPPLRTQVDSISGLSVHRAVSRPSIRSDTTVSRPLLHQTRGFDGQAEIGESWNDQSLAISTSHRPITYH